MKKTLLLLFFVLHGFVMTAQITVNVPTPGGLSAALNAAGGNADTVTNLIVTGYINVNDFYFMNLNMPLLTTLNLEAANLPDNEMPSISFRSNTTLTNIILPANLDSIGQQAFSGTGLTGPLNIPNSVSKKQLWHSINVLG